MESFRSDLYYEDIHFRDNLQFEVETDFAPIPNSKHNVATQEFYFFIPAALQINQHTYSKEQFYKDRTNLIRYKTPEFSFYDLVDKNNSQSPLNRINALENVTQNAQNILTIQDELKLLGNIVRSALRTGVRGLMSFIEPPIKPHARDRLEAACSAFCQDLMRFREAFLRLENDCMKHWALTPCQTFMYVDEFISSSIDFYLTGFLEHLRASKLDNIHAIDRELCQTIAKEKQHRQKYYQEAQEFHKDEHIAKERVIYHKGLLNKYILDALLLGLERTSWADKYGHFVAGLAAGIAMLFYVLLIFLNVPNLGFNSLPFLLFTVVLYVLKDRIKDGLKAHFQRHAVRWFSDYTTQIKSPNGEKVLGKLKEFFSFVSEKGVPDDILHIRQTQFHSDLAEFRRPETIFYYKKEMELGSDESLVRARRHKLHTVFLFNIHHWLEKASNPQESFLTLNLDTMEVDSGQLPKVYHLNIVMKNSFLQPDLQKKVEIKKFRLIIDKTGIKRVETITTNG